MAHVVVAREVSAEEACSVLAAALGPGTRVSVEDPGTNGPARLMVRKSALSRAAVRLSSDGGRSEFKVTGAGIGVLPRAVSHLGIARRVARVIESVQPWQAPISQGASGGV